MHYVRNSDGVAIRKSKNLAGIIAHVGAGLKSYPFNLIKQIAVDSIANGEGKLLVLFQNGDNYETNFASYTVLLGWVQSRRNWRGANIMVNGVDAGKLRKGMLELVS